MDPQLHYQSFGEGAPLLLLHGLFGMGTNLGMLARELAREHRVIVPDLRNHGRSFHDPRMDYPVMAQDVLRLMDALDIGRAVLFGHSMGGKVAMQCALDAPQRVGALALADIAPVAYRPHHEAIFAALLRVEAAGADRRETARLLGDAGLDAAVIGLMQMNRFAREDGSWAWRFDLPALLANYANLLAAPAGGTAFGGPVLFLKGGDSDYIEATHAGATRALFPVAELRVVAGAGHWLHAEKPQLVLRLLRAFLARAG